MLMAAADAAVDSERAGGAVGAATGSASVVSTKDGAWGTGTGSRLAVSSKDGSRGSSVLASFEVPEGMTGSDSQSFGSQRITCWGMDTDNWLAMFGKDRPWGMGSSGKHRVQVAMGLAGSIDSHCSAADFSVASMGQDGATGGIDRAGIGWGMVVATGDGIKGVGRTDTVAGGSRAQGRGHIMAFSGQQEQAAAAGWQVQAAQASGWWCLAGTGHGAQNRWLQRQSQAGP